MNTVTDSIDFIYKYKEYVTNHRLIPTVITGIVLVLLLKFLPSSYLKVYAAILLIIIFTATLLLVKYGLPWERKWINQLNALIEDCDLDEAEYLIRKKPKIITYTNKVKLLFTQHFLNEQKGDNLKSYLILQKLRKLKLFPNEKEKLDLCTAKLIYYDGNYNGFTDIYDSIKSNQTIKNRFSFLFIKALHHEIDFDLSKAIHSLELAIENTTIPSEKIAALNNLARVERMQGNFNNAQGYLEKALDILKNTPSAYLYHIIIYNLIWNQIDQRNKAAADRLFIKFYQQLNKNNPEHIREYLNLKTEIARQTGDRKLLEETYQQAEKELKPLLHGESRLAYMMAEFTMRFNDNYQFQANLKEMQDNMPLFRALLSTNNYFFVLSEMVITLRKYLRVEQEDAEAYALFSYVTSELFSLSHIIDENLKNISSRLPGTRDYWHIRKILLLELRIDHSKEMNHVSIENLFQGLTERKNTWKNKGDQRKVIEVLLDYCEHYLMYKHQFGQEFISSYVELAEDSLRQANDKLLEIWQEEPEAVGIAHYAIGLAYFYWQIGENDTQSAFWVRQFEETQISPLHLAKWLQVQLKDIKYWLSTVVEIESNHS